jgi:hypothetical protein
MFATSLQSSDEMFLSFRFSEFGQVSLSQAPHHLEQKCQIHLKRQGMLSLTETARAARSSQKWR